MALVLLIDDSELLLQMLDMVCTKAGHETVKAANFAAARDACANHHFSLVVSDLNLPDCVDPLAELKELTDAPIVAVSGRPQEELDTIVSEKGIAGAISKDAGLAGLSDGLAKFFAELSD